MIRFVAALVLGIAGIAGARSRTSTGANLADIIENIEQRTLPLIRQVVPGATVWHFGAYDIDPRHLVFAYNVETDPQRDRLQADARLQEQLREIARQSGYPPDAVAAIYFSFESKETVDRDYGGNWFYAYK